MKKLLLIIACMALCMVLLTGCRNPDNNMTKPPAGQSVGEIKDVANWKPTPLLKVNNFKGVSMAVKEGSISNSAVTVVFKNNSKSQCIYGEDFSLEKKLNGKWYQVPVVIDGNYGFTSIGYNLPPGASRDQEVKWEWLYGRLDPGQYRIVKSILDFRGTGNYDTYNLVAEFEIDVVTEK